MEFVETSLFSRYLPEYLDDEGYRLFQVHLVQNPEVGAVIPGTGGLRKVRWADPRRGKGKRGGLRVLYTYFPSNAQIFLIALYDKSQADDLTTKEKKVYREIIQAEMKSKTQGARLRQRKKR